MTQSLEPIVLPPPFPDHTQLPESDGTFVKNFQKHPQSLILTDSIGPILQQHHPDGQYAIGQDCGIYWRETDPPERGAEAPDWFYVPNVPPKLDGQIRGSYVLWREFISPLIALEFASGNGEEERDPRLRWWDEQGNLLLIGDERAEQERQRADSAEQAIREAVPRLLAMGLSIAQVAEALNVSVEVVETINNE